MPESLEKIAKSYPQVVAGTSCNKTSYKAGGKSFLFVGEKADTYNVLLKLKDCLPEAEALAKKKPDQYFPGSSGWVKVEMPLGKSPPKGTWQRWIDESFRLIVPKKIVAEMSTGAVATSATKKKAKKKPVAKKAPRKKARRRS